MVKEWQKRCDNDHLGHFLMDYMRKRGHEICQIDAATGEEETCASVLSRSIRLAICFQNLGLVPGDAITVAGKNHLDGHIPFYAGTMSGQPIAGIDPSLKCNEMKHVLSKVRPKIAFCEYTMVAEYKKAVHELSLNTMIVTFGGGENCLAKFIKANQGWRPEQEFEVPTFNTDEVYWLLVSTSGTTGRPKLVALTHSHMKQMFHFALLDGKNQSPKNSKLKSTINLSNLHWLSGCFNALLIPMTQIKIQTSAPVTPEHVIDIINKYKPEKLGLSPNLMMSILHHEKPCDLSHVEDVLLGASAIHKELLVSVRAAIPQNAVIHQAYGMTEIGGVAVYFPENSDGKLDPKFEAKIVSPETGKEILEPNVTGELYLRGPRMACYYKDPEETENLFTDDGFIKTGDLLYRNEHGGYVFVDRLKMLLKYRSYHVVPSEVEEVIMQHPGVLDVCVTGVPHLEDGDRVMACVMRKPGEKVTAQEIKDIVGNNLSDTKHLRGGVVFMDELPTTSTGKIARAEIKKLAPTLHAE